jgi:polysaccharide biosynthesis protein PelD
MSSIIDENGLYEARFESRARQPQPRDNSRWRGRGADVSVSALLQLAGFFVVALVIDHTFLEGNRFAGVQPHPFWIPVVLLSLQFGTNAGLLAVLTAGTGLLAGNLPEQMLSEDRFSYLLHLSTHPLLWLATALVIGEMRSRQLRSTQELLDEHERIEIERDTIAEAYQDLKSVKMGLEMQVAGQTRTLAATCKALAGVNLSAEAVLGGAHRVIRSVLSPQAFSLFLIDGTVLRGVSNEGWQQDTRFLRCFDRDSVLYRSVIEEGRILCVARPEDEVILGNQGMLAGPLRDMGTGEVLGMLKIEQIDFQDMTLDMLGVFQGVCDWINMVFANHRHIETMAHARLWSEDSPLLAPEAYTQLAHFLSALGQHLKFQTLAITVNAPKTLALQPNGLKQFANALGEAAVEVGGTSILIFDRQEDELDYMILLPYRAHEHSALMMEALRRALRQAILRRLGEVGVTASNMLSMRAQKLDTAKPEPADLDRANV